MAIKKAFVDLHALLSANSDKKVKSILEEATTLMSAKSGGFGAGGPVMFKRNEAGEVTHVFCYYHKMWEDVREVDFGAKAGSTTGLNRMCKEGVSAWTKQSATAKKANAGLLTLVAGGDLAPADIPAEQEKINLERAIITPRNDGHGFTDEQMDAAAS